MTDTTANSFFMFASLFTEKGGSTSHEHTGHDQDHRSSQD